MNTKRKNGKKAERSPRTPKTSPRGVQAKMQLLGFVRGKDTFLELITGVQSIDQTLKASYEYLRACAAGSVEEDECVRNIRQLEDQRFRLLSELHGNRVQNYHLL